MRAALLCCALMVAACSPAKPPLMTHADSVRELGPRAWSDSELLTFLSFTTQTLSTDHLTVRLHSRNVRVVSFARRLNVEHGRLLDGIDSLLAVLPLSNLADGSLDQVDAHENRTRELANRSWSDLSYLGSARMALESVLEKLGEADSEHRSADVGRLLGRARIQLRGDLHEVRGLETSLQKRAKGQ